MKPQRMPVFSTTLILLLGSGPAFAQDGTPEENDVLEITMRLLPPNAQAAEAALREIELPTRLDEATEEPAPIPSEQGQLHGGAGLERANEARFEGVANGAAAAEAAQNNREEMGRGTPPDLDELLPDQVPDNPGPPDNPGRP